MIKPHLTLSLLSDSYAICRLPASAALPGWALIGPFYAVTRTREELSIVCHEHVVPPGVTCARGWRGLMVAGPLEFGLTGVLANLAVPLAEAGVSIFAISTYDTDYLLVREHQLVTALDALRRAGHTIA
jgi:hypothetical protein